MEALVRRIALLVGLLAAAATASPLRAGATCVDPPPGMVGWWPGDGTAEDIVGGNDGQAVAGATHAAGLVGDAFSFDGVDDRIELPDLEVLKLTGSFSIDAWVFIDAYPTFALHGEIVFRGDERAALDPYALSVEPDGFFRFHIESLSEIVDIQAVAPLGRFVFVAVTLDASTGKMSLYVDGVLQAQTFTSVRPFRDLDPSRNPGVGIGNHPGSFRNEPFEGLIDEVEIFGRCLTSGEVLTIFEAGSEGKCKEPPISVQHQSWGQIKSRYRNP
jgi:hypothetical protein